MSEEQNTPAVDDTTTEQPGTPATEQPDTPATEDKPTNEAAKYRVRAREAEARVEELTAKLEALQRREVEAYAAGALEVPGDVFEFSGHGLAEFLDEEGNVSPELVEAATAELVGKRPGLARGAGALTPNPHQGRRGVTGPTGNTLTDAFRPRR